MNEYVELRVHGVSGTSAESLLGVKDKDQVEELAGDKYVRFMRPKAGSTVGARPGGPGVGEGHLEGMSWGKLTSGSALQATWLLLLPFALINLAYWARTWSEDGIWTRAYRWLVRVLGLSLTATMVFTVASASMDLLGWQCVIRNTEQCLAVNSWLDVVAGWTPGRVLAAAALAPALTIAALALLSHRTSLRYESFRGTLDDGDGTDDPQLFSSRMWRGDVLVGRLRTLHLGVGLVTGTAILARAALSLDDGLPYRLAVIALCLAGSVLVACLVLSAGSAWLSWAETGSAGQKWVARFVWVGGLVAFLLAEVASILGTGKPPADEGHLVGLIATGHVLVFTQIAILALLLMVMVVARIKYGWIGQPHPKKRTEKHPGLAWWGFAGWLIAALAVLMGFAYSAAVVFRVSDLLTGKVQKGPCEACSTYEIAPVPAPAFEIAAFATGVFVVLLAVLLVVLFWKVRAGRKRALQWVHEEYSGELKKPGLADDDYRVQRAVRARAFASAVSVNRFGVILLTAIVVGLVAGGYAFWDALRSLDLSVINSVVALPEVRADAPAQDSSALARLYGPSADPEGRPAIEFLRDFGAWATAGLAAGLVALGGIAWRDEKARRIVGIIWDIVSFFPRAGHPLAPPCYAERAVPQLVARLTHLVSADSDSPKKVVLAGHSQGSLLAVAAIAQLAAMDRAAKDQAAKDQAAKDQAAKDQAAKDQAVGIPPDDSSPATGHVALLTFGSPLMRLHAPLFPRIFGPEALRDLPVVANNTHRWINLWRRTDPIGGTMSPVLEVASDVAATPAQGDLRLRDPAQLVMDTATSAYPPVYGHIDYDADPAYEVCVDRLINARP